VSIQSATQEWLTQAYDYEPPRRGQVRQGVILKREAHGIMVDIGLKRDGFVPQTDVERLDDVTASELKPGQEVDACIVKPGDQDNTHVLSLYQARQERDWLRARQLLDSDEIWQGEVTEYNKGGLLVKFDQLQAFVPASQLWLQNRRRLSATERQATLKEYIGQKLSYKIIEVNRARNRLIVSERMARQQIRQQNLDRLLKELVEGEVHQGTVRQLRPYGAFIDLGGANGLIHNSELSWRRVRHPSEIVQVGDELEVYILHMDHQRKRISLSLKRLQPSPWNMVLETYVVDQLVAGRVTNVLDFGAFVALDVGVEGLVHISELADPQPQTPQEIVQRGDELVLRILSIDPFRQRLRLSLKRVSLPERDQWLAQQVPESTEEAA
jgi:small subunit ribosomal protein S1